MTLATGLIIGGKWSLGKSHTWAGSSLLHKYWTRREVTETGKHTTSLIQCGNNYSLKKFYSTGPKLIGIAQLVILIFSKLKT
jgi:hypothetical protein